MSLFIFPDSHHFKFELSGLYGCSFGVLHFEQRQNIADLQTKIIARCY